MVAFLADAAYVAIRLPGNLLEAARAVQRARAAVTDGRIQEAQQLLSEGAEAAAAADSVSGHPSIAVASWVPRIGRDVRAVRALSSAAHRATEGGLEALAALESLGATDQEIGASIFRRGRVRFGPIEQATPHLQIASAMLARAGDLLLAAPRPSITYLGDLLDRARDDLEAARSTTFAGARVLETAPELFAKGGRRSYLLAFQALGEARGTGGVALFYGVLEADDGRLRLSEIAPVSRLPGWKRGIIDSPVDGPEWLEDSYGSQGALRQWQQANLTPNFPVAADVLLQIYERFTGRALDGVLAMDPITLEHLMPAVGPIDVFDTRVTADNVADLLLRDSYVRFDSTEQNLFIAEVVEEFWTRVGAGEADMRLLGEGIAAATRAQHFKLFVRDAATQGGLADLGANGFFDTSLPNVQLVYHQNYGLNKIDYYLHRSVDTEIRLDSDGSARVATEITLENRAPARVSDTPTPLLGVPRREGIRPGWNQMLLSILAPKGVQQARLTRGEQSETVPFSLDDSGFPVFWDVVKLRPKTSKTLRLEYVIPNAVGEQGRFEFTLFPQTMVNPERYSIAIHAPEGDRLLPEGERTTDVVIRASEADKQPLRLVVYVR